MVRKFLVFVNMIIFHSSQIQQTNKIVACPFLINGIFFVEKFPQFPKKKKKKKKRNVFLISKSFCTKNPFLVWSHRIFRATAKWKLGPAFVCKPESNFRIFQKWVAVIFNFLSFFFFFPFHFIFNFAASF